LRVAVKGEMVFQRLGLVGRGRVDGEKVRKL